MSINSQQYANLTHHAYGEEAGGKKGQMQPLVGEKVTLEGVTYKVVEYMDQPPGYQSAIHQHVDTGEIVVTHCCDISRDISPAAARSRNVPHQVAAFFDSAMRPAAPIKKLETRRHHLWLGLGVMLSLSACNLSTPFGSKPVVDYKQNQTPEQRYDITLTIADAPGPFASMEGLVQYDVVNQECLPPPNSNPGGYSSHRTFHVPFALTQVSEHEYKGTVYADMMLDEDYYGRGVCQWKLIQARVHMKATGAEGETLFIPSLSADALLAQQSEQLYFLKRFYPRTEAGNLPDIGISSAHRNPALPESAWFSIALAATKGSP